MLKQEILDTFLQLLDEAGALAERLGANAWRLRLAMTRLRWQPNETNREALRRVLGGFDEGLETPDLRDAAALLAG